MASPSVSAASAPAASIAVEGDPVPLEVIDAGYSPVAGDEASATYAAVIRNPNASWAAVRMEIHVDFLGADGSFIAGEEVVVTVLPGQETAIGGRAQDAGAASSMQVGMPEDVVAFQARAPTDESFTIDGVETQSAAGQATTTGTLTSGFETDQSSVTLVAVHHDAGGAIVGGGTGAAEFVAAGGSVEFAIVEASPSVPIASTEVYWQVLR